MRCAVLVLLLAGCPRPQSGPPPVVEAATLSPLGGLAAIVTTPPHAPCQIRLFSRFPELPTAVLPCLHEKAVTALAFSPDGQLVASVSPGKLVVQRVAGGQLVRSEAGAVGGPNSIAWTSDGKYLASIWHGGARVFPIPAGEPIRIDHPGATLVAAAAGLVATAALGQNQARTFDLPSGAPRGAFATGGSRCLALSPEGRFLAAGRNNGDVVLWDLSARPPAAYSGAQLAGAVDFVEFLPGARLVAALRPSGSEPGYVQLVRLDTGGDELARRIQARQVYAIGWNHSGLALLGERCDGAGCILGIFRP